MYTSTENRNWIAQKHRRAQQGLDLLGPGSWWPDSKPSPRVTSPSAQAVQSPLVAFGLRATVSRAKVIAWKSGADLDAFAIWAGNEAGQLLKVEMISTEQIDMDSTEMAGGR